MNYIKVNGVAYKAPDEEFYVIMLLQDLENVKMGAVEEITLTKLSNGEQQTLRREDIKGRIYSYTDE